MSTTSIHPAPEIPHTGDGSAAERHAGDLLDHEYDGIREYDNPLPRWWVLMFWGSFFFSIAYVAYYASGRGQSVTDDYESEMKVVRAQRAKQALLEKPSEASLGKLSGDEALMLEAKTSFGQRCSPCHGPEGQGLIGPNLTDEVCIHGEGGLMDIYEVVSHGVPAKGMPAWDLQLKPDEIRKLVAYVGTLHGKNLPGKAPEGRPIGKR